MAVQKKKIPKKKKYHYEKSELVFLNIIFNAGFIKRSKTRICQKIVQICSGSQNLSSIEVSNTVVSTKSLGDAFYLSLGKKEYGSGIRMISLIDYKWYYSYCACAALVKTTAAMRTGVILVHVQQAPTMFLAHSGYYSQQSKKKDCKYKELQVPKQVISGRNCKHFIFVFSGIALL